MSLRSIDSAGSNTSNVSESNQADKKYSQTDVETFESIMNEGGTISTYNHQIHIGGQACGKCHGTWSRDPKNNQSDREIWGPSVCASGGAMLGGLIPVVSPITAFIGGVLGLLGYKITKPLNPSECRHGFINDDLTRQTDAGYGTGPGGTCELNRRGYDPHAGWGEKNADGGSFESDSADIDDSSTAGDPESTEAGSNTGPGGACENGRGGYD